MTGDVIAAISTPIGRGGISVIRLSGEGSAEVAAKVFRPRSHKILTECEPRRVVYGDISGIDGEPIDDGTAVRYAAPASYTGEDSVEISCHGGVLLTAMVLESLFSAGARQAEAGEFTKRAYLSGKLGLLGAEAVIDKIDAETRAQVKLSSAVSRGILSGELEKIYARMKELVSAVYVRLDFPDEDLGELTDVELAEGLSGLEKRLEKLISTYRTGLSVSRGIRCCIAGKPNVGKSSLLNALAGSDRAIVTDVAGTTRDIIEERAMIGDAELLISDTAGLRRTDDTVEKLGVERAYRRLCESELILAVFDGSEELDERDFEFIEKLREVGAVKLAVVNKCDLGRKFDDSELTDRLDGAGCAHISAKSGEIGEIRSFIAEKFIDGSLDLSSDAIITNARQYASAKSAADHVKEALSAQKSGYPSDIVCGELELAMSELSGIDGRGVSEDIVDDIFHRFCVGK